MADNDLEVKFGAQTSEAIAGIDQVKSAISGLSSPVQSAMSTFASLGKALVAAFAIDRIAAFADQYAKMGEQIEHTSAMLGISAKSVQELGFIAETTGGSAEGMSTMIERLQLNLQRAQVPTSQQAQALRALGLSAKDLIGVPVDEQLNRIADAASKFADGGNKTAIVMALLGRTGAEMIPVLDQGRAGLDALRQSADATGAVMSKQTVGALAGLDRASIGLRAALTGLAGTIVGTLAPALTQQENSLTKLIGDINIAIQTHTAWEREIIGLQTVVAEFSQWLVNLGTLAKDVFTLNWGSIIADRQAGMDKIAAIQQQGEDKVLAIARRANSQLQQLLSGTGEGLDKAQAPAMNTNISELTAAMQSHYAEMIKQIDDFYNLQKQRLSGEAAQYKITYSQETAALLQALDARHAGEDAAYDAEIAAVKAAGKNYEAIQKEKTAADDKWRQEHEKIVQDALQHEQAQWQSMLGTIESAFNSQLRGLLAGTTTWKQAFEKMLGDLIIKFIEMCETMVVKWAAAQLAQTTAATTGAAARTAAEEGSAAAGMLSMVANAVKAIMTDAGQAFAGVFAFLAPTMGPAAAGPAAAAQASVSAAAIFDVGTDYVVRGGLALIHPGETIVPEARGSGPFTGTGMGAQVHAPVSINVSALDSQSVARFFNDNHRHMMKAINDAVKRGAHLGLRMPRT